VTDGLNIFIDGVRNMADEHTNKPIPCELLSWAHIDRLAARLVAKIQQADYRPDIVVAIARGGYVPARLVCDHMDIFDLTSIRIIHYEAGATMMNGARLCMGLGVDVRGLKVLVVDDVTDTGESLQLAISHIQGFGPAALKVAVLQHKSVSSLVPDFYAQKIVKWRWLTYPWAIHEDVGQFIAGMRPRPASVEDARRRLQQEYDIRVSTRIVREVLAKLV
jgi:hypoxanthine phosphoribosyltransferase